MNVNQKCTVMPLDLLSLLGFLGSSNYGIFMYSLLCMRICAWQILYGFMIYNLFFLGKVVQEQIMFYKEFEF